MLDLRLIREQPEAVARALVDKGGAELIDAIVAQDTERRRLIKETDDLKALRNRTSAEIGKAKGSVTEEQRLEMRRVGDRIFPQHLHGAG